MKKSITAVLAAAILMTSLCSCGRKTEHDHYREIYKRYNDLHSFSATVEVTVQNSQGKSAYTAEQKYKAPDWFEVTFIRPQSLSGSGYVFDGETVLLKSGFGHTEEIQNAALSVAGSVSVADFFEEFYKSEETSVLTESCVTGNQTCLNCFLPGKNKKRFRQSLWIDNDTYLPIRLETYGIDEKPTVTVEFCDFVRNEI